MNYANEIELRLILKIILVFFVIMKNADGQCDK